MCLDEAIEESINKELPLMTSSGTNINLVKRNNGNYKIVFNTEKSTYEAITKDNLYKFLFEDWRGNESLGRDDSRITLFEAIKTYMENNCDKPKNQKNPMAPKKNQPLNQILYGPPGTGKTYNTINRALEIIDGNIPSTRAEAKKRFDELRDDGQIVFTTFHQSFGYEEFVEGIKAKTSDKGIEYEIEAGIFKKLSKTASKNIEQTKNNTIIKKDFDVIFKEKILDKLSDDEKLEIKMKKSSFYIKEVDETHINFDKSGGDSQHVLLIKNLRIMYEAGENKIIMGGLSQYYNPLLEYLLDNNEIKNEEKEPLKNYILIIDEINRGNISKIFGELITLIEPSKRLGEEEEIQLKLPYSNDLFGVPSNLYIIGTMNTADRSIAQIDTALRRRFEFVEMMPDYTTLDGLNDVEGINIPEMLRAINERICYIYDREHQIGHSYFLPLKNEPTKVKLDGIFRVNIIPLLAEYFYGDWGDIRIILNNDFVKEKEEAKFKIEASRKKKNVIFEVNSEFKTEQYARIYETNND
jgi:5-methylcytosine-specific restriction protein B